MRKTVQIPVAQESWALATQVTYSTVPSWYGCTVRDLKCSILMPKSRIPGKKHPLLVWICGGGFQVMDRDVWIPQWVDFARSGCIVASIDYRTGSEATFPVALLDVKAAIRYLRANAGLFSIDPDRVAVAGESAGGTLACLAGVTGRDRKYDQGANPEISSEVQGVIDFYGVADLRPITDDTGALKQLIGSGNGFEERIREASAVCHVTKESPPFLILHGTKDNVVDLSQSEGLYDALMKAGVRAEFYVFEGAGHGEDAFYQAEPMRIIRSFMDSI